MAVAPKYTLSHILSAQPSAPVHTIELYLDYVCPYSASLLLTLHTHIFPMLSTVYPRARFILRHQVQPWHPTSTLVHEAALAVGLVAPERFLLFSVALMARQAEYFDGPTANEGRNHIYRRLAELAAAMGVDQARVLELLTVGEEAGNAGNRVTDDLKIHIKAARRQGIHVSPTVVFNGVVETAISSAWMKEQWVEWLDKNVR
ncbi:thioredoxin-like protein [Sphaerosporella brunnea]|uniref:Thioredoxin-like protein n=1 Tax=Sphaerosporella brunnea TaxID=1250544 RepID=A0A5J5EWM6_9PEZI|nr:thioredoxin-like protein [Sphaerosporella brunnea]